MIIDYRLIGTDQFPDVAFTVQAQFKSCNSSYSVPITHWYTTKKEAEKALETLEERPSTAHIVMGQSF